ncbi:hypothetical protein [Amycolatopsis vastitatis]|nr:hypothetical protein [Amycolatopsis vastitatis]
MSGSRAAKSRAAALSFSVALTARPSAVRRMFTVVLLPVVGARVVEGA